MAIPGYKSGNVAEFALDRTGARVAVVAGVVPEEFGLERSVRNPPATALADPVDIVGHDDLRAVEAFRISLVYDPTALPPGSSPTDVAIAVKTSAASETQRADGEAVNDDEWERLESRVDLEEATVTAVLPDRPAGSTVVPIYDDHDDERSE